eukprot:1241036-Amphidinium_carterae.1
MWVRFSEVLRALTRVLSREEGEEEDSDESGCFRVPDKSASHITEMTLAHPRHQAYDSEHEQLCCFSRAWWLSSCKVTALSLAIDSPSACNRDWGLSPPLSVCVHSAPYCT